MYSGGFRLKITATVMAVSVLLWSAGAFAGVNEDLSQAAMRGDVAAVQRLIGRGAKVNAKDKSGWTALMLACQGGKLEAVKALLDRGADVNAANSSGINALMIASENGYSEIVKVLLGKGAEVNAANRDDWTALSAASWGGYKEVVEALIAGGAEVNAKSSTDGATALTAASLGQRRGRAGAARQWGRRQCQRQGGINRLDACLTIWPPRRRAGPARRKGGRCQRQRRPRR